MSNSMKNSWDFSLIPPMEESLKYVMFNISKENESTSAVVIDNLNCLTHSKSTRIVDPHLKLAPRDVKRKKSVSSGKLKKR